MNMTQEQKDLLLKDLCVRLPHGVKISIPELWTGKKKVEVLNEIFKGDDGLYRVNDSGMLIEHIKPYLFPLSSITKEQFEELQQISSKDAWELIKKLEKGEWNHDYPLIYHNTLDWLDKNHFDYRDLIPMDLAIDCTNLNIY